MTDTLLRFRGAMGNSPLQGHAATPPVQALNAGAAPFVLGSPIPAIPTPPPVENDVLIDSESILRILRDATAAADTGSADGGDGKVAATTTPQQLPVPTTSFAQLGSSFSKNMTTDEAPLFGSSMWGSTSAYPAVPHSTPAPYSVSPTVGQGPAAILVRNSHGIFLLQPAIGSPMPGPSYSAPAALQQQQASPPLAPPTVAAHHHHNHHHQHAHTSFGRGVSSTYRSPQAGGAAAPPPPTYMSALRDCNPDETPGSLASNIPMGAPSFALNRTAAIPVQRNNASPALGASPPPYHGGGASFGR